MAAGRGQRKAYVSGLQEKGAPKKGAVFFCETKYKKKYLSSVEAGMSMER